LECCHNVVCWVARFQGRVNLWFCFLIMLIVEGPSLGLKPCTGEVLQAAVFAEVGAGPCFQGGLVGRLRMPLQHRPHPRHICL
jgi:hypothetical protein